MKTMAERLKKHRADIKRMEAQSFQRYEPVIKFKKCLSCDKRRQMPENNWICLECKKTKLWQSGEE
jgi:hypothetical protein